jgi:hypothetical protein
MNNFIVISHYIHPLSLYLDSGGKSTDGGHDNAKLYTLISLSQRCQSSAWHATIASLPHWSKRE